MKFAITPIIFASLVGILVGCVRTDELRSLSGFWVSTDYFQGKAFQTLLIRDSVAEMNRYGIEHYSYPLFIEDDAVVARYPFDSWEVAFNLSLRNDTLIQIKKYSETDSIVVRYVACDSTKIKRDLLLFDSRLHLHLPEAGIENIKVLPDYSIRSEIYIGKLRKASLADFPLIKEDSLFLQVYDVFIPLNEIGEFLKIQKTNVDETDRERIFVLLYASEEVPDEFLRNVVETIHEYDDKLSVYRAMYDWVETEFRYENISHWSLHEGLNKKGSL